MSYYEEDNPEMSSPSDEWVERIRRAVEEENPQYIPPVDKAEERHREMMEMLGGIFVQISRLYDILLWESPHRAVLDDEHSKGGLYASPPTLREDAWHDDQEDHLNEMEDEKE